MSMLTVRKLPETVIQGLRHRAQLHGRSTEAEVRAILAAAALDNIATGSALARFGRDHKLKFDHLLAGDAEGSGA
jgi:plasmid stability protein